MDWVRNDSGSLNLIARAGTGKTSTLLMVAEMPEINNAYFGAYNKAIAVELDQRLAMSGVQQQKCRAATLHSAGFQTWRGFAGPVEVDAHKTLGICDEFEESRRFGKFPFDDTRNFIRDLVSIGKQSLFQPMDTPFEMWVEAADHFGITDDLPEGVELEQAVTVVEEVYRKSASVHDVVDFDDMLWLPLIHGTALPKYDWVMIDEAQDTNAARRELAVRMLARNGRFLAVGDPRQAIYGFTGANHDAMDLLAATLKCRTLPLNLTYRCPKHVVRLANQWVPDFYANESNPDGKVWGMDKDSRQFQEFQWRPTDAILCRLNRPLVELAFDFIRRGIPCRVEGREIGQHLIALCKKWKTPQNTRELLAKLEQYLTEEKRKWRQKNRPDRAQAVEDSVGTAIIIGERLIDQGKESIQDMISWISNLFGDDVSRKGVTTLSTVHKAKGREWDRVFILGRNRYMPSKWARQEWELLQEHNLMYVAVTRAKSELCDIHVQLNKKEEEL